MKPLTPEAAARLRRELAAIDLDLAFALAEIQLTGIQSRLDRLEAMQRQRRWFAQSAAQAAAAEHTRQVRQAHLNQGLAVGLFGSAAALFASAPRQHPMGLRNLDD